LPLCLLEAKEEKNLALYDLTGLQGTGTSVQPGGTDLYGNPIAYTGTGQLTGAFDSPNGGYNVIGDTGPSFDAGQGLAFAGASALVTSYFGPEVAGPVTTGSFLAGGAIQEVLPLPAWATP